MKGSFTLFATGSALVVGIVSLAVSPPDARAQSAGARELPARSIPVPDTASPQMQKTIAAPINPNWRDFPKTGVEWKTQVDTGAAAAVQTLPALRAQLHVKSEPATIDSVRLHGDARDDPARKSKPIAHSRPWRLLLIKPRRVRHD